MRVKKDLNIERSRDRFSIDFGMFFGGLGEAKTGFSLESGTDFDSFASCNISCLLDPESHRFWGCFGGQVGHQNRTCWLQEGKMWDNKRVGKTPNK